MDVKEKNSSATVSAEKFITTEEKAQYEIFRNGSLPRETIEKWIRADIAAIRSLLDGIWRDEKIFGAIVDQYYARYQELHTKPQEDGKEAVN